MLVHRHVWNDGTFSNWHEASRAHTKEEYANDTVFEEREVADRPKKGKATKMEYSYDEFGQPIVPPDLYNNPPEYTMGEEEPSLAVNLAQNVIDAMIEADPALVTPQTRKK